MNTNEQILSVANGLVSDIRIQKDAIGKLKNVKSGLSGDTQKNITIFAGGSSIDIGISDGNYGTEVKNHFSLASTFIRKGINMEIESRELIVDLLTKKLNNLTFKV